MVTSIKSNEPTPNGGDWSEIIFFDDEGNLADESTATRCVIRECLNDGTPVFETWGICNEG